MPMGKMTRVYKAPAKAVPAKVKTYVKKMITAKEELKMYDLDTGFVASSVAGVVQIISSGIPTGTAYNNRIGDEITPKYLEVRGVAAAQNTQSNIQTVRYILFQDMGNTGFGTPVATDVLQSANPLALLNSNNRLNNRFKILEDKIFTIGFYTGNSDSGKTWYKKIRLHGKMNWTFAGTANKGQIYSLTIVDNVLGAPVRVNASYRLYYEG